MSASTAVDRPAVTVPAHYGSPAGELAACVRSVGITDRRDLAALVIDGPAESLDQLLERLTGTGVAPGGLAAGHGVWWCRDRARVYVLCEPRRRERLEAVVRGAARRLRGVEVGDRSDALATIALAGRRVPELLAALGGLGAAGRLRAARPFAARRVAGRPAHVVLAGDRLALLVVAAGDAGAVWRAAEQAGRPLGLALVGTEALHRFALLQARAERLAAVQL